MAWTVIKKFIDARTARKIEVFSSVAKGQQRLHELVDQDAIPSDFGGTSPSSAELMQGDGGERHIVKVVDLNTCKKGRTVIDLLAGSDCLKEGETVSIDVFSRSVVGCRVSILGSDKHTEEVKVKPAYLPSEEGKAPIPRSTNVCTRQTLRGTVQVQLTTDGSAPSDAKNVPHGVFLVAATLCAN